MFIQTKAIFVIGNDVSNSQKIDSKLSSLKIKDRFFSSNPNLSSAIYKNFLENLPAETIFSVSIESISSGVSEYYISVPFFSSHMSLPIKIGEKIWTYLYNSIASSNKEFAIKSYYLGRVHGILPTEDVSYCYHDRENSYFNPYFLSLDDSFKNRKMSSSDRSRFAKNVLGNENLIYFSDAKNLNNDTSFIDNSYLIKSIKDYSFSAVPKIHNNLEDITLQGSYNTYFSLKSNNNKRKSGKIDIVAGTNQKITFNTPAKELSFFKKSPETNQKVLDNVDVKILDEEKRHFVVFDNKMHYETVKSNKQFFNLDESLIDSKKSFFVQKNQDSFYNDLSSLIVSESSFEVKSIKDKFRIKYDYIVDNYFLSKIKYDKDKEIETNISYTAEVSENLNNDSSSSILCYSDNITLCLHDNNKGNLELIQPNSFDGTASSICLNYAGNVHIDGSKILIGDYDRLTSKMHGKTALVYLGYSKESQSLVLGEQLKKYLEEVLEIQSKTMDLTKSLFLKSQELDESIQTSLEQIQFILESLSSELIKIPKTAPVGALITPFVEKLKIDISAIDSASYLSEIELAKISLEEEMNIKVKEIKDSLPKILSKFSKTS